MSFALFMAVAFNLANPAPLRLDWGAALDRLAPKLQHFRVSRDYETTAWRFVQALDRAGIRARYDFDRQRQIPGFYLALRRGVARVRGAREGIVVFLHRVTQRAGLWPDDSMLVYFCRVDDAMRAYPLLRYKESLEGLMPDSAVLTRGKELVVSGTDAWMGNGPRVGVRTFRRAGRSWLHTGTMTSEFESWGAADLELSASRRRVLPLRIESRTWAKNLNSSHWSANLAFEEQWSFSGGKPRMDWKRLRNTPFNALDRLYLSIIQGRWTAVREACLNGSVAKRLLALAPKAASGEPYLDYPGSISSTESTVIGLENLGVRLHYVRRRGKWLISRLSTIPRGPN